MYLFGFLRCPARIEGRASAVGGPRGSATDHSDRGSAVELRSGPAPSVGAGALDACALKRGKRGGCAVSPTVPPLAGSGWAMQLARAPPLPPRDTRRPATDPLLTPNKMQRPRGPPILHLSAVNLAAKHSRPDPGVSPVPAAHSARGKTSCYFTRRPAQCKIKYASVRGDTASQLGCEPDPLLFSQRANYAAAPRVGSA